MSRRNLATMDTDMFTPIGRLLQQAMAHGIENDMIFGGLEVGQTALQSLYVAQTTKNCSWGTRRVKWDGRVYKYGKAGVGVAHSGITSNKFGVKNGSVLVACKDNTSDHANEVVMTDAAVGATKITVTFDTDILGNSESFAHSERIGVVPEDNLRGGYISLYTGDYRQQRMIVGNTAVLATDQSMIIELDEPLDHILTAGESFCEILGNPYVNLYVTSDKWTSVMGMPNVTALVDESFWLQTWGILRISATTTATGTQWQRHWVFNDGGAIIPHETDYNAEGHDYQNAGFLIERTQTGEAYEAAPFIMLQISP